MQNIVFWLVFFTRVEKMDAHVQFLTTYVAKEHKCETKADDEQVKLPTIMRPIFAITMNEAQYNTFLNRLGPTWRTNVVKWLGTVGSKIDPINWLLKQKIRTHCRLTPNELGLYDSHVRLWRDCVRSGRFMFIVEDHVQLQPSEMHFVHRFWKHVEEQKIQYDFMYVAHNNHFTPIQYVTHNIDDANVVVPYGRQGLSAYVITPKGAAFLLDKCTPYEQPIDVYVQHRLENDTNNEFRCYAMYPSFFHSS